jgi:glycosyltransferase involved in cell wall biosynthesis
MKLNFETAALIPAFNEGKNIVEVVSKTKGQFNNVVVVDDGSSDDTAELAGQSGAMVVKHTVNLGKGAAMKTGIDYILGKLPAVKYIVIIDADMQFKPEDAPSVVGPLADGKADVVMGNRNFSKVPFRHRLGNFVWRTAFNLFFGTKFKDTNCGYIALTSRVAKEEIFHGGYIIENRLLAECVKRGFRVGQVPVDVEYRKASAVPRGIRVELGVLTFIVKEGLKYRLHL